MSCRKLRSIPTTGVNLVPVKDSPPGLPSTFNQPPPATGVTKNKNLGDIGVTNDKVARTSVCPSDPGEVVGTPPAVPLKSKLLRVVSIKPPARTANGPPVVRGTFANKFT